MEATMNARIESGRLNVSAALVALFVICLVVALVLPGWPASHAWIALFSVAPLTSIRVWVDGIVFSWCSAGSPRGSDPSTIA
jgi:hypothetical protein